MGTQRIVLIPRIARQRETRPLHLPSSVAMAHVKTNAIKICHPELYSPLRRGTRNSGFKLAAPSPVVTG